jgi:peptide/nickel transport system substrate-binding protein
MPRRLWVSLTLLAVGAGLLTTAQLAGASNGSSHRYGGIFRVGIAGASTQIDPQVAYVTTAWWLEYATAAKLFNYPDRNGPAGYRLVPEVASGYTVSNGGKTYTFTVRKGFRFSDGTPVTAKSFQYAIDRVANHDLASPGAQYITDQNGTNIVGAQDVNDGKAKHVRGVVVKGNKLIIRLTRPDSRFLNKLATPFFQATSTKLPLTHEVVGAYPSAGPYAFTANDVNVLTSLRRNRYWKRGPGRVRPRSVAGVDVHWNLNEQNAFAQVKANQLDEGPVPVAEVQGVANRYGVNRTRLWEKPLPCLGYLAFNRNRALFKNNVALRQAINWAVDRVAYAAAAGPYGATPWTHLLPPGFPGSITAPKLQPYSVTPRLGKARKLARGHFRTGKITVGYRSSGTINPAQAQLVRRDLIRLGFKPDGITLIPFSGAEIYRAIGKLDMGVSMGWCSDATDPDPTAMFNSPLGVGGPKYSRKLAAANRLSGAARLRALGRLDLEVTSDVAPVAVMRTYNSLFFFSNRVVPESFVYSAVYSDSSIPALALK